MRQFFLIGFLVLAPVVFAPSVFALSLGAAGDYNAFIFGDFTAENSDIEGRLAAGGNVTLESYKVGSQLKSAGNTLVAGGNLTYTNGTINNGNAVVGGLATLTSATFTSTSVGLPVGTLTQNATVPINFEAEENYLLDLSGDLAKMTTTGTVENQYGTLFLTGDSTSSLQVFNIDGASLSAASWFAFGTIAKIPEDATIVINVSGVDDSLKNFNMEAFSAFCDNVLFNFYAAASLNISGGSIKGSVLAPLASVTANNGNINGTIIADSWNGGTELHNVPFEGTETTPTPEPGTMVLLSAGLIGLAGLKRRLKK